MWFSRLRLIDLLFPSLCIACEQPLSNDHVICGKCCDGLTESRLGNWVDRLSTSGELSSAWSAFWYDDLLQKVIHRLKYSKFKRVAPYLARLAFDRLDWEINWDEYDTIVPVPLHRLRRRKRGFNQAELIALEMGKLCSLPVDFDRVVRTVNTSSQVGLGIEQRRQNMAGSFSAKPVYLGERVLLIDDVLTSGATSAACGAALLAAGYEKVSVLTIATPPKKS